MTVFNKDNLGYVDGAYPLFLGQELGLVDTINVTYPQIEELYQLQLSQIWNEFEVDLSQDRIDMLECDKDIVELMVKTISWQHLGDTIATKSIAGLLLNFVTNPELENLTILWSFFETIHARTYSHIVKQTMQDSNQMLQDTYTDQRTIMRSEAIQSAFEGLEGVEHKTELEQAIALLKSMTGFLALEAIAFMSSFAVTFGIGERKVMQGIVQDVKLICRDEILHTRFDYEIIKILMSDDPKYGVFKVAYTLCKDDMKKILDSVTIREHEWADSLFQDRSMIGLNAEILKRYTNYAAKPAYDLLGFEFPFEEEKENPLPYMDKYTNGANFQAAPQEIQITSYRLGAVLDDQILPFEFDDSVFEL